MDSNSNSTISSSNLLNGSPYLNGISSSDGSHSDLDKNNFSENKLTPTNANIQTTNASLHSYELRSRSHNSPNQRRSPQIQFSTGVFVQFSYCC